MTTNEDHTQAAEPIDVIQVEPAQDVEVPSMEISQIGCKDLDEEMEDILQPATPHRSSLPSIQLDQRASSFNDAPVPESIRFSMSVDVCQTALAVQQCPGRLSDSNVSVRRSIRDSPPQDTIETPHHGPHLHRPSAQPTELAPAETEVHHISRENIRNTMMDIHNRLSNIVSILCGNIRVSLNERCHFVMNPSDELSLLYQQCFGEDWRSTIDILSRTSNRPTVFDVLVALINAFVHRCVHVSAQWQTPTLPHHPLIDDALLGTEYRNLVQSLLSNDRFNQEIVRAHAHGLAEQLLQTIEPHIEVLANHNNTSGLDRPSDSKNWQTSFIHDLKALFETSLILRCKMDLCPLRFEVFWPAHNDLVDLGSMNARYSSVGPPSQALHVAFPIHSGVRVDSTSHGNIEEAANSAFHKATVVMWHPVPAPALPVDLQQA
jgi:hypothetical protein